MKDADLVDAAVFTVSSAMRCYAQIAGGPDEGITQLDRPTHAAQSKKTSNELLKPIESENKPIFEQRILCAMFLQSKVTSGRLLT